MRRRCFAGRTRSDQRGFMLMSVVVVIGLISIIGVVLIGMSLTALRISAAFRDSLDVDSAADSGLEAVVHDLQRTVPAAGQDCYGATDLGGGHTKAYQETVSFPDGKTIQVIIDCTSAVTSASRDVTLVAFSGGAADPAAKARVVIVDEIGGVSRPGLELRICDWQLGRNVRSTVAACP